MWFHAARYSFSDVTLKSQQTPPRLHGKTSQCRQYSWSWSQERRSKREEHFHKKNIRQPTVFLCSLLQGVCVFIARPCRQRLMLLLCTYFYRVLSKPKIEKSPTTVSYLYIKLGEGVGLVCATYKRSTSNIFF